MKFIPADLSSHLELDRIIHWLKAACISDPASTKFDNIQFYTEKDTIESKLNEVSELKELILLNEDLPIEYYEDIESELLYLGKAGYVLEIEQILKINNIIQNYQILQKHFSKKREKAYTSLRNIVDHLLVDEGLQSMIGLVIDEKSEIRENASPELSKISKAIREKEKDVQKVFNQLISRYKSIGILSENYESVRNGRRVMSVPAEHKRKVHGIIHDQSATGKTFFIEPVDSVEINNAIIELQLERRKEIYRILSGLCDGLRPYIAQIQQFQEQLVYCDCLRAKAKLGAALLAEKPILSDHAEIDLKDAVHPILFLKNKQEDIKTIRFDLNLNKDQRIIVISGPNAGGKSVTLKAIGLVQLLCQMGCLIPANENSRIGIFHTICCDIGDQQSLEDDLSTYSSRLQNMNAFLQESDERTLILIDEFGSGTDPKIGGAIAEAILHKLHSQKVIGVITTHYSNLKLFAFQTKGIVNGAMYFDSENLRPTYELQIGKPGSSFAFEIAQNAGLDKKILNYAKKRAGKQTGAVDQLVIDLQREKKDLEEILKVVGEKEKEADKLIRNYDRMSKDLDIRRKKLKLEQKHLELTERSNLKKEIELTMRQIKEKNNEEEARRILKETIEDKKKIEHDVNELKEEIFYSDSLDIKDFKVGDYVKLKTGSMAGKIERIQKKKAEISVGNLKMSVPLHEIVPANAPLNVNPRKRVNTDLTKNPSTFKSSLDIRGYRKKEAMQFLEEFMDQALIANYSLVKILHGKGNGVLKRAVWQKLNEYRQIRQFSHPEEAQGGEGVTLVYL